ncbi:hypothetical protein [Paramicrobacterium fandaimingii]|uniref:hypothetical protein n=1 Tax=Paramicrobacterium fandaimingii TaxID=2708079 RepID=UPI00141F1F6A|nr:hypothetical protein [Microbacterium fandaimingii]
MRIGSVVNLHTANRFTAIGQPLMIAGMSFSFILVIGIVANLATGGQNLVDMYNGMVWNGAIFALLGPLMGIGIAAMTQYFPLATGFGLTRNEFSRGTSLVFIANAVFFSIIVTVGKMLEEVTEGWGLHIRFFNVVYTGTGPAWQTLVQTFLLILAFMFVGAAITTVFNRWGQLGLWLVLLAFTLVTVAGGALAFLNDSFASWLFSLLSMGWAPWMGVLLAVGVVAATIWAVLVRRAQAR